MVIELLKSELEKMDIEANYFENLQSKDGIYVYRIKIDDKTAVMKYFEKEEYKREILCYRKLKNDNIDTIPILYQTDNCIIMEDMNSNDKFRIGIKDDLSDEKVIKAIAKWYKQIHSIKLTEDEKNNFYSEAKLLTKENLETIQEYDSDNECFRFLKLHEKELLNQHEGYKVCLNYNDFYYTNLVVAKDKSSAFMFDYNLLGVGYGYNDIRNVCSSLKEDMKDVFLHEYGEFDLKEKITDEWMSPLLTLIFASQRDSFPNWAMESLESLKNGSVFKAMKQSLGSDHYA
ncbi:MAG: hypothetical protein GX053_11500 [Tissierella sp.]|nr:hypothetical protein [Tissierella sp.]